MSGTNILGGALRSVPVMAIGVALCFATNWPASAHDEKDPRHKAMTGLAHSMKAISQTLKSGAAIDDDTGRHAAAIAETSARMLALFPQGSGGHHGRAKPEIWSDWAGFAAKAEDMEAAADDLVDAVGIGDPAAVGAALKAVGATCGGCHDLYRKPKK